MDIKHISVTEMSRLYLNCCSFLWASSLTIWHVNFQLTHKAVNKTNAVLHRTLSNCFFFNSFAEFWPIFGLRGPLNDIAASGLIISAEMLSKTNDASLSWNDWVKLVCVCFTVFMGIPWDIKNDTFLMWFFKYNRMIWYDYIMVSYDMIWLH